VHPGLLSVTLPNSMGQPVPVEHKLSSFSCWGTAASWLLGMVYVGFWSSFRKVLGVMSREHVKEQGNSRDDLSTTVWGYSLTLFSSKEIIGTCRVRSD